jgi:hypothetical protein
MKVQLLSDGERTGGRPIVRIELTRRNLEVLLAKLDDPKSARTIIKDEDDISGAVTAVENDVHYGDRDPGTMYVNGEYI